LAGTSHAVPIDLSSLADFARSASMKPCTCRSDHPSSRRRFLGIVGASAIVHAIPASAQIGGGVALTKEQRDAMTPAEVLDALRTGNERFRAGKTAVVDYRNQKRSTASGQYPAAVILGCIDSRAPAEIIFDTGIGDTFNARIAGNVVNDDLLGSMEFACAAAGAKLILLFGHTACGAVKGAIDNVVLGNLTGLLARVKPAIAATEFTGDKSSKNPAFVDAVARTNVRLGLEAIRQRSAILADLEKKHSIHIVGAMYDLATGVVEFMS
jgi:carbonic anhydrase